MKTIPIISLWQPWASWVALGWKPIETRLHKRFRSLEGETVGIHAALKWDNKALDLARPYLSDERIMQSERFLRIGGAVICTAVVVSARPLTGEDSQAALIDCASVQRFGLVLAYVKSIEAVTMRGRQGIWYAEVPGVSS